MKDIVLIMFGILMGSGVYATFKYFNIEALFIPSWSMVMIIMFCIDYFILERLKK